MSHVVVDICLCHIVEKELTVHLLHYSVLNDVNF